MAMPLTHSVCSSSVCLSTGWELAPADQHRTVPSRPAVYNWSLSGHDLTTFTPKRCPGLLLRSVRVTLPLLSAMRKKMQGRARV